MSSYEERISVALRLKAKMEASMDWDLALVELREENFYRYGWGAPAPTQEQIQERYEQIRKRAD